MVPAGTITKTVITEVGDLLGTGDLVIDGGNSRFSHDFVHAALLAEKGIDYIDAGASGGVWGQENGFALMVGGSAASVDRLMPVFDALHPAGPREESFVHAGEVGAGHYAKMVHNGIKYALMQAYAEGYELLSGTTSSRTFLERSKHGSAARSSGPGCSSSWFRHSRRIRPWPVSKDTSMTPARAAGPSKKHWLMPCPFPPSAHQSSPGSNLAKKIPRQ